MNIREKNQLVTVLENVRTAWKVIEEKDNDTLKETGYQLGLAVIGLQNVIWPDGQS